MDLGLFWEEVERGIGVYVIIKWIGVLVIDVVFCVMVYKF